MEKLKFDNEGCYGIIAKDFTVIGLSKLASAISQWLFKKHKKPSIVIGYDTRFGNEIFVETLIKIFASKGISVFLAENFSTSAMISYATLKINASCGIILTGRNEHGYTNGIRIFDSNGLILSEKDLKDIEILNQESFETDADLININNLIEQGFINYVNLNSLYLKHINDNINLYEISKIGKNLVIDVLYGSTQDILKRLFPNATFLHDKINPIFDNLIPECDLKNFHELAELIDNKENSSEYIGIGLNAEGTKFCLYTKETGFINMQDIILILLEILIKHKNFKEKAILSSFVTKRTYKLCNFYNHSVENIKNSINSPFLIKIEDENKIYIKDKFNFNDAVFMLLMIIEYLNETKSKLNDLIKEIQTKTGITTSIFRKIFLEKNKIIKFLDKLNNNEINRIGSLNIKNFEIKDCYLFELDNNSTMAIRFLTGNQFIEIFIESEDDNVNNFTLNEIVNFIKTI